VIKKNPQKQTNYNISFVVNDKYLSYASASILSIIKNNPSLKFKFFVISGNNDFSANSQNKIKKLCTYFDQDFEFVKIPPKILTKLKNIPINTPLSKKQYGYFIFAKLYICEFLNTNKVLNLDADMICVGSIKELLDEPFGNKSIIVGSNTTDKQEQLQTKSCLIKNKLNKRERERERARERERERQREREKLSVF
jgi:lipopolysaccharide biosynthesis glycosyltransferase